MGNPSRFDKWSDDPHPSPTPADAVQPLDAPQQVEITTIEQAMAWGESWMAAHAELLREFRRLEVKCQNERWDKESAEDMLRHYRHIVGMIARGEDISPELYE